MSYFKLFNSESAVALYFPSTVTKDFNSSIASVFLPIAMSD